MSEASVPMRAHNARQLFGKRVMGKRCGAGRVRPRGARRGHIHTKFARSNGPAVSVQIIAVPKNDAPAYRTARIMSSPAKCPCTVTAQERNSKKPISHKRKWDGVMPSRRRPNSVVHEKMRPQKVPWMAASHSTYSK